MDDFNKCLKFLIWLTSVLVIAGTIAFTILLKDISSKIDKLENKEVHYLLPDTAKCRVKMMAFRDKDGNLMPMVPRKVCKQTEESLCHWSID